MIIRNNRNRFTKKRRNRMIGGSERAREPGGMKKGEKQTKKMKATRSHSSQDARTGALAARFMKQHAPNSAAAAALQLGTKDGLTKGDTEFQLAVAGAHAGAKAKGFIEGSPFTTSPGMYDVLNAQGMLNESQKIHAQLTGIHDALARVVTEKAHLKTAGKVFDFTLKIMESSVTLATVAALIPASLKLVNTPTATELISNCVQLLQTGITTMINAASFGFEAAQLPGVMTGLRSVLNAISAVLPGDRITAMAAGWAMGLKGISFSDAVGAAVAAPGLVGMAASTASGAAAQKALEIKDMTLRAAGDYQAMIGKKVESFTLAGSHIYAKIMIGDSIFDHIIYFHDKSMYILRVGSGVENAKQFANRASVVLTDKHAVEHLDKFKSFILNTGKVRKLEVEILGLQQQLSNNILQGSPTTRRRAMPRPAGKLPQSKMRANMLTPGHFTASSTGRVGDKKGVPGAVGTAALASAAKAAPGTLTPDQLKEVRNTLRKRRSASPGPKPPTPPTQGMPKNKARSGSRGGGGRTRRKSRRKSKRKSKRKSRKSKTRGGYKYKKKKSKRRTN